MRELNWNEHEVVECLGVVGHLNEDSAVYEYKVERDGFVLELGICPHESYVDIQFPRYTESEPVFETGFLVRDEIVFVSEKLVSYMEFRGIAIAPLYTEIEDLSFGPTAGLPVFQVHTYPRLRLIFT